MVLQKIKYSKISSSSALLLGLSFLGQCIVIKWKQWQTLFSWASKSLQMVIAAMKLKEACSLEEKLWPTLDSILKSRNITLSTKVHLVKAMVFPVVVYGCESWTIKKAECWRIDAFELWYWRRFLRVPWSEIKPTNPKGDQINQFQRTSTLNVHWMDLCWSWSSSTLAT